MAATTSKIAFNDALTSDISALLGGYVGTAPTTSGRITATQAEVDRQATLINTLCAQLDRLFSGSGPWNVDRHMIKLCLSLAQHVYASYDGVFQGGDAPHRRWLSCFIRIATCMNACTDEGPLDGTPTHEEVKNEALMASVGMIRALSSDLMLGSGRDRAAWTNSRECLEELLSVANGRACAFEYNAII